MRRVVAFASVAALLAVGCGSDGAERVSADQWAEAVCRSFGAFTARLQGTFDVLGELPERPGDSEEALTAIREVHQAFLTLEDAMTSLGRSVRAAGPPDVQDGDDVARDLVGAIGHARERVSEGVGRLETLDSDDAGVDDFVAAGEQFRAMGQAFDRLPDVDEIGGPEIDEAFDRAPGCRALERRLEGQS